METLRQLKEAASQNYIQKYWESKIPTYSFNSGGFNFDEDSSKAFYNTRANKLPSLQQMWSEFRKGAQSRGLRADYLTFKNFYDQIKNNQNKQFLSQLQTAELQGIPLDKIHDVLRENPDLRQDLINATADGSDESNTFLAQYFPKKEKSLAGTIADNPELLAGGTIAAGFGIDYARTAPGLEEYNEKVKKSDKIKADAKSKYDKYIDKNHPTDKSGKKISKTKTVKGKRVSNPAYKKFTDSKGYKAQTTQYKNSIKSSQDIIKDLKKPEARYKNWLKKTGGKGMGFRGGSLAAMAPIIVESGANMAGVKKKDAELMGDVASGIGGAAIAGNLIKSLLAGTAGGPGGVALNALISLGMLARPGSKLLGLGTETPEIDKSDYIEVEYR